MPPDGLVSTLSVSEEDLSLSHPTGRTVPTSPCYAGDSWVEGTPLGNVQGHLCIMIMYSLARFRDICFFKKKINGVYFL